jgi:hypothetical protein
MKSAPWTFHEIPAGWADQYPDGDYTIGRGADPRSAEERARDPDGSLARAEWEAEKRAAAEAQKKSKLPPAAE